MTIRGQVDGMEGRHVIGWALPATGRKRCRVAVIDEAGERVVAGQAALERPDLAALGSVAFRLALPECPQHRRFRILADGVELPGSPLEAGPGRYDADCVVAGGVLTGWVRERIQDLSEPSISIVTQHGAIVGLGQSSRDAHAPHERAGFKINLHYRCFGAGELRLAVLADGVEIAEAHCEISLQGSIDLLTATSCSGWLNSPEAPSRPLEIEIFRNGVPVAVAGCEMHRWDIDPQGSESGFTAYFPCYNARETEATTISLRLRGSPIELFDGPFLVAGREAAVIAAQRAAQAALRPGIAAAEKAVLDLALREFIRTSRSGKGFTAARQPPTVAQKQALRLNIIIPVYGDVAATKLCIDSVLLHRIAAIDRVILIDDSSPAPEMAPLLAGYAAQPNLFVLRNKENLGFIKTVNRGFSFAAGDVLLLNADTIVFPGVFDELTSIAQSAADIGTVTALSNDATIFSYPGHEVNAEDLADGNWAALAEAALAANAGIAIEVPTGHGFCMLIKAEVLRRLGSFDEGFGRGYCEENAFCAAASDLGYRHVAAAGVFVQHGGSRSFGVEKAALLARNLERLARLYPEYFPKLHDFEHRDGLRAARWALDRWRLERARQSGAQFVLVICHSMGGGSAKAAAEIEQAAPFGAAVKLSLNSRNDGSMELFAQNPAFRAGFSVNETDALFELLNAAAPSRVQVHQLLGFPAAFIRRLTAWVAGRHSVFFLHDFYALCPRVTFIDAAGDFCHVAATEICERCVAVGGVHETSKLALDPAAHRASFREMLRGFSEVVAPSASAADLLLRGFPEIPIHVIPHPESGATRPPIRRAEDTAEITLFGALGEHKGALKLLEIARRARLTHPAMVFRVIGYTSLDEQLLACGNVIISGRYSVETLPLLVAEARGRLALFLHIWPETYSYTLSEALAYGFLPLVPDIGAPAERLRKMQFGVIYPQTAGAAEILGLIADLQNESKNFFF